MKTDTINISTTPWEENKMGLISDARGNKVASMYMHIIYRDTDKLMQTNAAYIVSAVNTHEYLKMIAQSIIDESIDGIDRSAWRLKKAQFVMKVLEGVSND